MSAEGSWNLVVDTPMGKQQGTLDMKIDGQAITGSSGSMGESDPIENGVIDGDTLTFQVHASKPMPMKLAFELTVDGDALKGQVAIGSFGKATVTGTRA